jgi:hypothetical protein
VSGKHVAKGERGAVLKNISRGTREGGVGSKWIREGGGGVRFLEDR